MGALVENLHHPGSPSTYCPVLVYTSRRYKAARVADFVELL